MISRSAVTYIAYRGVRGVRDPEWVVICYELVIYHPQGSKQLPSSMVALLCPCVSHARTKALPFVQKWVHSGGMASVCSRCTNRLFFCLDLVYLRRVSCCTQCCKSITTGYAHPSEALGGSIVLSEFHGRRESFELCLLAMSFCPMARRPMMM